MMWCYVYLSRWVLSCFHSVWYPSGHHESIQKPHSLSSSSFPRSKGRWSRMVSKEIWSYSICLRLSFRTCRRSPWRSRLVFLAFRLHDLSAICCLNISTVGCEMCLSSTEWKTPFDSRSLAKENPRFGCRENRQLARELSHLPRRPEGWHQTDYSLIQHERFDCWVMFATLKSYCSFCMYDTFDNWDLKAWHCHRMSLSAYFA